MKLALAVIVLSLTAVSQQQTPDSYGNYTVTQFGAKGDHATDDTIAIQSAYDTLCPIAGNGGLTLIFPKPVKDYRIIKPIRVTCPNVATVGQNQTGTIVRGASPQFIWGGKMPPFPLTTAPDGAQTAMILSSSQKYWLNMVDLYQVLGTPQPLDGLTQLNVRFVFQVNSFTQGGFTKYITSAQSGVFPHSALVQSAYSVSVSQNQNLGCTITTTTGTFFATSPARALDLNTWHVGECDWDGANLRIRLDGQDVGVTPADGRLVQTVLQNMTVGTNARFLDTGYTVNMIDGALSSLQISNSSRAASTSLGKFASDASTVALFNFTDQSDCVDLCTKVQTMNGKATAWLRYAGAPQVGGPVIENMDFGGAVVIIGGPGTQMRNVSLTAAPYGLYLFNNDYASNFTNLNAGNAGPGCLAVVMATSVSGVNDYRDLNFNTQCAISMLITGGYSGGINHAFFSGFKGMQYGLVMVSDQANEAIVCTDCSFSEEAGAPTFIAPIALSGPGIFTMNGGQAESFFGGRGFPMAYFDGITTATFLGVTARIPNNPAPSEFFHFYAAPQYPLTLINFFNNLNPSPAFQYPMSNLPNTVQAPQMQFLP